MFKPSHTCLVTSFRFVSWRFLTLLLCFITESFFLAALPNTFLERINWNAALGMSSLGRKGVPWSIEQSGSLHIDNPCSDYYLVTLSFIIIQ